MENDKNIALAGLLFDFALAVKGLHWTVRGNDALPLHEQLDDFFDDLISYADRLFEDGFANDDDVSFDASLKSAAELVKTEQVIRFLKTTLEQVIAFTEQEGVDRGRRGTANIVDDIAEGLTNWLYLFKIYQEPSN